MVVQQGKPGRMSCASCFFFMLKIIARVSEEPESQRSHYCVERDTLSVLRVWLFMRYTICI